MNKENVFVWNNSAVTNAVIKKLEEDSNIKNIYCSDRNIINLSKSTIALKSDGISLLKELKEKQVKYVFSNTEANEKGFIDYSLKYKFSGLGANYKSLKLESSKAFSKIMMQKYDIKTADFVIVNNRNQLQQALNQIGLPCYIKADGYARSISAIKIYKEQDFFLIAEKYLNGYFYGNSIIIVEKEISGQEISIPCIVDGKNIKMIAAVKDYKRRNNNDLGSNTGGMGSICPLKTTPQQNSLTDKLLKKLTNILMQEDLFYKGFITLNVIFAQNDIYLLEINTRLGDSEGQTVLKYLDTNILDIFAAVEHQTLDNLKLKYKDGYAMSVNIINRYYPEVRVFQNAFITKDSVNKLTKDFYFYRRVYEYNTKYIQINDRIMSIIDFNRNIEDLRTNIYKDIEKLEGQNIFYRTDLGKNIT